MSMTPSPESERNARSSASRALLLGERKRKGYPTPEDDRFWAAASICGHADHRACAALPHRARANQPTMIYPKEDPVVMASGLRPSVPRIGWSIFGLAAVRSARRSRCSSAASSSASPKLKVFFAETRLGWVPFWARNMDLWLQAPPRLGRGIISVQAGSMDCRRPYVREKHLFHGAATSGVRGRNAPSMFGGRPPTAAMPTDGEQTEIDQPFEERTAQPRHHDRVLPSGISSSAGWRARRCGRELHMHGDRHVHIDRGGPEPVVLGGRIAFAVGSAPSSTPLSRVFLQCFISAMASSTCEIG